MVLSHIRDAGATRPNIVCNSDDCEIIIPLGTLLCEFHEEEFAEWAGKSSTEWAREQIEVDLDGT